MKSRKILTTDPTKGRGHQKCKQNTCKRYVRYMSHIRICSSWRKSGMTYNKFSSFRLPNYSDHPKGVRPDSGCGEAAKRYIPKPPVCRRAQVLALEHEMRRHKDLACSKWMPPLSINSLQFDVPSRRKLVRLRRLILYFLA